MSAANGTVYGVADGVAHGTVYGIGRNYAEHARELGNEVPTEPLVFLKPRACLWTPAAHGRDRWPIPAWSSRVDHEVELVVRVGRDVGGRPVAAGIGVGIDLTARDLQTAAKQKGQPWALAKGLRGFAPCSEFRSVAGAAECRGRLELRINGETRQVGEVDAMLWGVGALLAWLDARFPLEPGDLIFTGTPPGVGPLAVGDRVEASFAPAGGGEALRLAFTCGG